MFCIFHKWYDPERRFVDGWNWYVCNKCGKWTIKSDPPLPFTEKHIDFALYYKKKPYL